MTSERHQLIAANWKMNKTNAEAAEFCTDFSGRDLPAGVDVVVCPPYTALRTVVDGMADTAVQVAAQNMHDQDYGAFTGEISAPMLLELGVSGVVLGHSEQRQLFGETDAALAKKVPAALAAGLLPILCVGETEEEREAGETQRKLRQQVQVDLAAVATDELQRVVIAYEPIWAIGTGKTATP
jgi:triosephosphate isomerase (TIM)